MKKRLFVLLISLYAVLFFSCNNILGGNISESNSDSDNSAQSSNVNSESAVESSVDGKTYIKLISGTIVESDQSRTIVPDTSVTQLKNLTLT